MSRVYNLKREVEKTPRLTGGHRLCAGCGAGIVVSGVLRALNKEDRAVVVNATSCLEVSTFMYPYTAYMDSYIHSAFENSAFPPSTRYPMILEAFQQYKSYDLILIEFGDLARLEKVQDLYSDRQLQQARKTVLKKIDLCIGDLQKQLINTDVLYVISPTPSRLAFQRGELLTPLIIDKPGMAGLLTSYSTHYDGIVSSISLKNSILHNFNPTIPNPIYSQSLTNTYDTLTDTSKRLVFQYVNQALVIPILIVLILLSLVLTLLARVKNAHPIIQNFFMTFVVAFPLSLLLIANFDIFNSWTIFCFRIYE
jgi:hypothetical protein